jgi:hypothetical protein
MSGLAWVGLSKKILKVGVEMVRRRLDRRSGKSRRVSEEIDVKSN